ncbi:MAG: hypothetical protein E7463_11445 [Ruminococcaceae bacterium]|nr:hypothetical protein [Oscillospiraceae bacterium]
MILSLDYGTTALKAVLFDENFAVVGSASEEFIYNTPENGAMEYPAEGYMERTAAAVRRACAGRVPARIVVTGQAETLIPADAEGHALDPAVVWLDNRAAEEYREMCEKLDIPEFYRRTGNPAPDIVMPLCKIKWLYRTRPEQMKRARTIFLLRDWMIYRFTGEKVSEYSTQSCSGYFDINKNAYDAEYLRLGEIDESLLCKPMPSAIEVGGLTKAAAEAFGLPAGIPVHNGMLDQCSAHLGAGGGDLITETTGTVMALASPSPVFTGEGSVLTLRHGINDQFLRLPYCPTAGMALRWFRDNFAPGTGFAELDRQVMAEPEDEGLICLPHFSGMVSPRPRSDARAAFLGMTLTTSRAQLARAVMEGVGFLLRENLESLGGEKPPFIVSLGGGAKSRFWCQLKADILGLEVRTLLDDEATARGAAFGAAIAAGELGMSEIRGLVQYDASFVPQRNYAEKYALYQDYSARLGY